ncbi:PREDICTED: uncharacterized protein LOC105623991, partial [Atta cephalotes]|uniref:Uncharacterized protein n=1 Tax=Atta cephalotes TaxID=12957 RepID=A0A158NT96_ATTCE
MCKIDTLAEKRAKSIQQSHDAEKTVSNSQSFKIVSDALSDKLIGLKLTFFSATASLFEPFLRKFQENVPMLMQRIVKSEILHNTSYLNKIDLSD